jgi:hypothetical protein
MHISVNNPTQVLQCLQSFEHAVQSPFLGGRGGGGGGGRGGGGDGATVTRGGGRGDGATVMRGGGGEGIVTEVQSK